MVEDDELVFDWDPSKAASNLAKHGVAFEEATTVFRDEHALLLADPEHSEDEDRFVLLGLSQEIRVLVVCHCFREEEELLRIISARRANPLERRQYAEKMQKP